MKMYKLNDGQITFSEFRSPFGKLDQNNRWVQMADMIPWSKHEKKYAEQFCPDNGAPAIPFRTALGTLLIKQRTGHSDEEVMQNILENPYMQFLIGLHEFTTKEPFSVTSITNFRKYISQELINEINDELFRPKQNNNHPKDPTDNSSDTDHEQPPNKGTIMLDATCTPADITYPTDVNLLNEARQKLEDIIDTLHEHTQATKKPRTYRIEARRKYLKFAKNRKPTKQLIRRAIREQLGYVRRNLGHIDKQLETTSIEKLSNNQRKWLETIRILYAQQRLMFDTKTHSVANRIVSISQPHVRPIVRGKKNAAVEFGAKVCISMIDGYSFIEKLDWEAYNESEVLIPAIEQYRERYGYYPIAVLVDQIFRNRKNIAYCKERGIRISGPKLGRPAKVVNEDDKLIAKQDVSARNAIEGKFGEGKRCYGIDRVSARKKESAETVIALSFLSMNMSRRLRLILCNFYGRVLECLGVGFSGLEVKCVVFG